MRELTTETGRSRKYRFQEWPLPGDGIGPLVPEDVTPTTAHWEGGELRLSEVRLLVAMCTRRATKVQLFKMKGRIFVKHTRDKAGRPRRNVQDHLKKLMGVHVPLHHLRFALEQRYPDPELWMGRDMLCVVLLSGGARDEGTPLWKILERRARIAAGLRNEDGRVTRFTRTRQDEVC